MPEIDLKYYDKLEELKKNEPDKYEGFMLKSLKENSRREALSIIFTSAFIYIVFYTCMSLYFQPEKLEFLEQYLFSAMIGAFIVMFFSNEIIDFLNKRIWKWYLTKYKEEAERLDKFAKLKKGLLLIKIIVPVFLSYVYLIRVIPSN